MFDKPPTVSPSRDKATRFDFYCVEIEFVATFGCCDVKVFNGK